VSRRKAREVALQVLFQLDFNSVDSMEAVHSICDEHKDISEKAKLYAQQLVLGTSSHLPAIDEIISKTANEWKLDRMAGVDRNIARMAIYEMKFADEPLSPNVTINEAVELAKKFGSEDSGRFVNGILGSLAKSWSQNK
jgi:N utilization substance protein B